MDIRKWPNKWRFWPRSQAGLLGVESARDHLGITASYWDSLKDIWDWKARAYYTFAQKKVGKNGTYGIRSVYVW